MRTDLTPLAALLSLALVALPACDRKPPESGGSGAASGSSAAKAGGSTASAGSAPDGALVRAAWPEELPPGWSVSVQPEGAARDAGRTQFHASAAAFALDAGETLHPLVSPAGLVATYSTMLTIEQAGRYRFACEVEGGSATITLFDSAATRLARAEGGGVSAATVATEAADLKPGAYTLSVRFARSGSGAARLRTLWSQQFTDDAGFAAEPIPPSVVRVPQSGVAGATASLGALHGRVLLGELGCLHCHSAGGHDHGSGGAAAAHAHGSAGDATSAVLNHPGPLLGDVGARLTPQWLRAWVLDPAKVKPGTHMPDLFGESEKDRADADALVHYLVSLGGPAPAQPVAGESQVLAQGRALYHSVGCVSCHAPLESPYQAFGEDGLPRETPAYSAPHAHGAIAGKWQPAALSRFLQDPTSVRPAGRMPSMNLSASEADLLATYLVTAWKDAPEGVPAPGLPGAEGGAEFALDPAKAEVGKAVFSARGCAACHQLGPDRGPVASTLVAKPLKDLSIAGGCMSTGPTTAPRYDLSATQRARLALAIEETRRAVDAPAPIDRAARLVEALNCRACHSKDGAGGVADAIKPYFRTLNEADLGDEGRLPPVLTHVGWKLNTRWLHSVLTESGRARPYMAARMPQYGALAVGDLAPALAAFDGVRPHASTATEPEPSDALVAAGRTLVGDRGLNCISCHVFDDKPPAGSPGPNITDFAERLNYDWWRTYVLAPARFKPGTRMPAFYTHQNGAHTGAVKDVLGGDGQRQIDAMWAYFNLASFAPAPEGLPTGTATPIPIGERPVVFRSFLKNAGSRAIAVGFPVGTHYAFDADACRLVEVWRGDFLDATGAWKGRGGQVTGGQGVLLWSAPAGAGVVVAAGELGDEALRAAASSAVGARFRGYALDGAGVPTLRYALPVAGADGAAAAGASAALVEDRIEPHAGAKASFTRTLVLSSAAQGPVGARVLVALGTDAAVKSFKVDGGSAQERRVGESRWLEVTPAGAEPVTVTLEVEP